MSAPHEVASELPGGRFSLRLLIILLTVVLGAGAVFAYQACRKTDETMRDDLLTQARMVAQAINVERVVNLSGSMADLDSSDYQRIKEQLTLVRSVNPRCRFLYLIAARGPEVIIFVDSESPDSKDYSPPGQVYTEVTDDDRRTITTGAETVSGPDADRWGTWISAFVPLKMPDTGHAPVLLGMDVDARDWANEVLWNGMPPVLVSLLFSTILVFFFVSLRRSKAALQRITDSEATIRESEERLKLTLEATNEGVWEWNILTGEVQFGPSYYKMLGYEADGFEHDYSFRRSLVHPDDIEALEKGYSESIVKKDAFAFEFRMRTKQGDWRWILTRGRTVAWDAEGKPLRVVGTHSDVTERKRAAEVLRESEERFRLAAHCTNDVIYEWDIRTGHAQYFGDIDGCLGYAPGEFPRTLVRWIEYVHPDDLSRVLETIHEKSQHGKPYEMEYRLRRSDGTYAEWLDCCLVTWDAAGNPVKIIGAGTDITERKRAEQTLADEAVWRRILIEQSRDGIVVLDENGKVYEANRRYADMLGYSAEEVLQLHVWDWDVQWPREHLLEMVGAVDAAGDHFETRHRRKDGGFFNVEISSNGAMCAGQKLVFCVCRDITERKRAQTALRESEERFRMAAQCSNDFIYEWDIQAGQARYLGDIDGCLGYAPGEFPRTLVGWIEYVHPDDLSRVMETVQEKAQHGKPYKIEYRLRRSDGTYAEWLDCCITTWDAAENPIKSIGACTDVTERKRAEEAVRESERNLRAIFSAITEAIFLIDLEGNVLAANEEVCRRLGTDLETLMKSNIFAFYSPEVAQRRRRRVEELLESGGPFRFEDERLGRTFSNSFYQIPDADGTIAGLAFFSVDITERKRAEQALRDSEELFRGMAEQLLDVLFQLDPEGILTYLSPSTSHVFGWRPAEMVGRHFVEFLSEEDAPKAMRAFQTALASGEPVQNLELHMTRKDGRVFPGELSGQRIMTGERVAGTFGLVRDVTERKQAAEALVESEKLLRTIINGSPIPAFIIGKDHRVMYWNKALEDISGVRAEEVVGTRQHWKSMYREKRSCMADLLLSGDTEKISDWFASKWTKSAVIEGAYEGSGFFPDLGEHGRWLYFTAALIRDSRGQVVGAMETFEDISERKRAEEESNRLASVVRHSRELVALATPNGTLVFLNDAGRKMLGISEENVARTEIMQVIPEPLRAKARNEVFRAIVKDGYWEGDLQYVNLETGALTDVHATTFKIADPETGALQFLANVSLDTTERKRAEEALQKSERRYRLLAENLSDVIWTMNVEGTFTYVSPSVLQLRGFTSEEVVQQSFEQAVCPGSRTGLMEGLRLAVEGSQAGVKYEARCFEIEQPRKDGTTVWTEVAARLIPDEEGQTFLILGISHDITERKRAEEALEKQHLFLRQVIDAIPAFVCVRTDEGSLALANRTLAEAYGTTVASLEGHSDSEFSPTPEEVAAFRQDDRDVFASRVAKVIPEERITFADGSVHWLTVIKTPLLEKDGTCMQLLAIAMDITERKQAEETREKLAAQLRQAQKMEAVGQLAGGVAHDFNNLLQVISGYGDILAGLLSPGTRGHLEIKEVLKAAERAGTLVRQLLAFSRRETIRQRTLELNDLIRDVSKMLRRVIGEHIDIRLNLWESVLTVWADPGQIEQVLMNLCVNARDAMPGGGRLVVETRPVELAEDFVKAYPETCPGQYVLLRVSDTGHGMEMHVLDHVFEPFFTTKGVGKGTGLGLASVYGIVKQHGGIITSSSEPGKGSAFSIYLPTTSEAAEQSASEDTALEIPYGTETILFAEDEQLVRNLGRQILTSGGYRVLAAKDGHEALELYETHTAEIALILLDVVMPGLSGKAVADRIKLHNPHIPILFSSGYDFDMLEGTLSSGETAEVIHKPYRQRELLRRIRERLDQVKGKES